MDVAFVISLFMTPSAGWTIILDGTLSVPLSIPRENAVLFRTLLVDSSKYL